MERLVSLGLADLRRGRFRKTYAKIKFPTTNTQAAIRSFHKQMIEKALEQLTRTETQDFESREISASTLAVPKSRIEEARLRIRAFHQEMTTFLTEGDQSEEVYQLNVQLFPLTKTSNEASKGE